MNKKGSKKGKNFPRRLVKKHIKLRTGLVFFVILGLMCLLLGRIVYINQNSGKKYSKKILSQMSYDSQVIEAERGLILDRNGTSLAYNENQYRLIIEPKNILLRENDYKATVDALVEYFGLERESLETIIQENKDSYYISVKKEITEAQKAGFLEYVESLNAEQETSVLPETQEIQGAEETQAETAEAVETESAEESSSFIQDAIAAVKKFFGEGESDNTAGNSGDVIGIYFEASQKRVYPYGTLASTTIGFANKLGGVTGLEAYYDDILSGEDGRKYGYLNQDSYVDIQTKEKTDGYSLETTLDAYIQKVCEDTINQYEEEVGSNVTAIMAYNPNNGEIYAMAQSRQYDLNDPSNLDGLYTKEEQDKLKEHDEELSKVLLLKWRNFCISNSYEPGSTAKLFTVAAGLEENLIQENGTYVCDGVGVYGGSRIHCHKRTGHGSLTTMGALMASCNDALMQMGEQIGAEVFCEYQSKFNLGRLTGIDLPDELSCANQLYYADNMTNVDLATNSFGQNYYVTMVQMCAAYASMVNGGNYYQPHVVKKILDNDGNVVENIQPKLVRQTVSAVTSEFLKESLLQVVANGTGNRVEIEGYEIGGKTGTAEKANKGAEEETYTVSFMAVAPAYDPELVLYVVVDEPNCSKAENTYQAKDLCKAVLEQILPYLNIYPTADEDDISNVNGDFTSAEDDEIYEDGESMIEDQEDIQRAEQIRQAAQNATGQDTTGNSTDQNAPGQN